MDLDCLECVVIRTFEKKLYKYIWDFKTDFKRCIITNRENVSWIEYTDTMQHLRGLNSALRSRANVWKRETYRKCRSLQATEVGD